VIDDLEILELGNFEIGKSLCPYDHDKFNHGSLKKIPISQSPSDRAIRAGKNPKSLIAPAVSPPAGISEK